MIENLFVFFLFCCCFNVDLFLYYFSNIINLSFRISGLWIDNSNLIFGFICIN